MYIYDFDIAIHRMTRAFGGRKVARKSERTRG
jgi:hypothetical protein